MAKSDSDFIDRLIERLDRLDPSSVQGYVLKLVREKGLLETIFQTIREGVIIIDHELKIEFVNQAAISLLGLPQNVLDPPGQKIGRYLRDLDWDRLMRQDPAEWERVSRREIEVFYPSHRYLLFYLLPYEDQYHPESRLGMATIILHDVTDLRRRAETELETERLNAITMLAAGVAHEIGNPLNSLNIHLQLLERYFRQQAENKDNTEAKELLEVALEEVQRLDHIINSFLKAIRSTPGEFAPVSLKDLVSDTLRVMKPEIQNRQVAVECEWGTGIPLVQGDPDQIKQALYNIIKNAIQAMPGGEDENKLHIALSAGPGTVSLAVADNGKGISPDELGNIFNPYYTTREDGTGLGLVIVERIAREHGAELGIESKPGRGTVFTITFPLRESRSRLLESPDEALPVETLELDADNA